VKTSIIKVSRLLKCQFRGLNFRKNASTPPHRPRELCMVVKYMVGAAQVKTQILLFLNEYALRKEARRSPPGTSVLFARWEGDGGEQPA
jgi:hypothetical protein